MASAMSGLVFVGIKQASIAGIHGKFTAHFERAIPRRGQQAGRIFEILRFVLFHPQRFGFNKPGRDSIAVIVVNCAFTNSVANFLTFHFGTGIHPDHRWANRFTVLCDRQHDPNKTGQRDTDNPVSEISLG